MTISVMTSTRTGTDAAPEPAVKAEPGAHPTREELIADFGDEYLSIHALFRFCFVPGGRIHHLKDLAVEEEWGANDFVLLKYLAVNVQLAIQQGCYVWNGDQIVLTAGRLVTPSALPIYAGIVRNNTSGENPWVMNWIGERPSCAELPAPPALGDWPPLDPRAEVVVAMDLSEEERRRRHACIGELNPVAQSCAIAGAVQWSLCRGMGVRQIHGGGHGYFIPLWFESREDLTAAPDFVAPVLVQGDRIVVRTLLDPEVSYAPARAVVERWEQLPAWLLDAWDDASVTAPVTSAAGERPGGDED
jgi:hypothetical protein